MDIKKAAENTTHIPINLVQSYLYWFSYFMPTRNIDLKNSVVNILLLSVELCPSYFELTTV